MYMYSVCGYSKHFKLTVKSFHCFKYKCIIAKAFVIRNKTKYAVYIRGFDEIPTALYRFPDNSFTDQQFTMKYKKLI